MTDTKTDNNFAQETILFEHAKKKQPCNKLIVGFAVLNIMALTGVGYVLFTFFKEL